MCLVKLSHSFFLLILSYYGNPYAGRAIIIPPERRRLLGCGEDPEDPLLFCRVAINLARI